MHMHIEKRTNDRRKKGTKKHTVRTPITRQMHTATMHMLICELLLLCVCVFCVCSFRTPNRITKNIHPKWNPSIRTPKKAFPPLCFIHFRCAAGVVVNNNNTHIPMCLCVACFRYIWTRSVWFVERSAFEQRVQMPCPLLYRLFFYDVHVCIFFRWPCADEIRPFQFGNFYSIANYCPKRISAS